MENQAQETQAAPVENIGEAAQEAQSVLGSDQAGTEATGVNTETAEAAQAPTGEVASDSTDFLKGIGEEYQGLATKKGFNNIDDVLKSYSNLEGMMGKRIDELTTDEMRDVYTKLGAPADISEYGFEDAKLPEGVEDTMSDWFADKSFELGLSKDAANSLRDAYLESQQEQFKKVSMEAQVAATDQLAELKTEFGAAFDERINLAQTALNEFGGDEVKNLINQHGLGNNPALVKMLSEIGKITSEGKMVSNKEDTAQFGTTPADAAASIADKFADAEFMKRWRSQSHPGHKAAQQEIMSLYKLKNGVTG